MPDTSYLQHRGTLDLSWNSLNGSIPTALAQCTVMVELLLAGNQFTGTIPPELSRLGNLTTVDLSSNFLNGTIPPELGDSKTIQGLNLAYNKLTGGIPAELGNIASLALLNVTGNMLTGPLPATLGNLTGLSHLDASENQLTGDIPAALANLVSIVGLNLAKNRLTGGIAGLLSESTVWHQAQSLNLSFNSLSGPLPVELGNLSGLAVLDLRYNQFNDHIPDAISELAQLNYMDVSYNQFVGLFPAALCDLKELTFLNVSYNQLSGRVPHTGRCVTYPISSFLSNPNLCGEAVKTECIADGRHGRAQGGLSTGAILGLTIGCTIAFLSVVFVFLRWRLLKQEAIAKTKDLERMKLTMVMEAGACMVLPKSKEPLSINVAMFEQPLLRLTLADILLATNNFCKTNIIGDGGFGTVYKAVLPDTKRIVAIKKLGASRSQGNREFLAEMETLGKVKHRT